ncbi:MAG: ATP-dependent DNA helicase RecG, partial [Candidatus Marinimicrobia bacterium]|nr:ATP-dependent DNA helicase RecG [Candidatus Neomarinimicrobiota bacterium]
MNPLKFTDEITQLRGVGAARKQALNRAGIQTISDLISYFPRRHLDRRTIGKINELKEGQEVTIIGKVQAFGMKKGKRRAYFQMILSDDT